MIIKELNRAPKLCPRETAQVSHLSLFDEMGRIMSQQQIDFHLYSALAQPNPRN